LVQIQPGEPAVPSDQLLELFGARYFAKEKVGIVRAPPTELYDYTAYINHSLPVKVERGDCAFSLHSLADGKMAQVTRGPATIAQSPFVVVVRGYAPPDRTVSLSERTNLPYVNGCSTRQLIHPERLGDPTLQLLDIPPWTAEQAHHIHSTPRVVYIVAGRGYSVVGMDKAVVTEELLPGMVCILNPMCPHHFETEGEHLICMPLHVWSSVGGLEHNHPMWNGTHLTTQQR
jgi:hypothetical protein